MEGERKQRSRVGKLNCLRKKEIKRSSKKKQTDTQCESNIDNVVEEHISLKNIPSNTVAQDTL